MTKNEFRAWFDGFCESMEGAPNEKQWERIKACVAEINDVPTTYPVFVDRYVTPVRPYWPNVPYWGMPGGYGGGGGGGGFVHNASSAVVDDFGPSRDRDMRTVMTAGENRAQMGDMTAPMKLAGRAEYLAALNS